MRSTRGAYQSGFFSALISIDSGDLTVIGDISWPPFFPSIVQRVSSYVPGTSKNWVTSSHAFVNRSELFINHGTGPRAAVEDDRRPNALKLSGAILLICSTNKSIAPRLSWFVMLDILLTTGVLLLALIAVTQALYVAMISERLSPGNTALVVTYVRNKFITTGCESSGVIANVARSSGLLSKNTCNVCPLRSYTHCMP